MLFFCFSLLRERQEMGYNSTNKEAEKGKKENQSFVFKIKLRNKKVSVSVSEIIMDGCGVDLGIQQQCESQ